MEQSLCQGKSLDKDQEEVLASKSHVADHIDMLEQFCKDEAPPANRTRRRLISNSRGLADVIPFGSSQTMPLSESISPPKYPGWPTMNESEARKIINPFESEPLDPKRYLCVSDGSEIHCLDLKLGRYRLTTELPLVSTFKLREKHLASVGLFNLGSDAYMIGGQKLSPSLEGKMRFLWSDNPKGYDLYRALCSLYKVKGTSRDTYCLTLVDDTLEDSESNNGKLNKPKLWPIVEKIDGQIHVIDSIPSNLDGKACDGWIFSNEVLNPDSGEWKEIPTNEREDHIISHSVVGHLIYAVATKTYLVFDSISSTWEAPYPRLIRWDNPFSVKKVWHVLDLGIGRCAGGFPYGLPSHPLYVLIAIVQDSHEYDYAMYAVAYLVTLAGHIVCSQRLPHFFEEPVKPFFMNAGRMINVDEEGKTMCSIVNASGRDGDNGVFSYLIINTFSVEELPEAALKVREIWANGRDCWPVEQDFVRVRIKNMYTFLLTNGIPRSWVGVQACFLTC